MSSPVVTPEEVLEMLMNDGTIDAIRLKVINQLKANEELKNNTITMVEQSKVLNTPGAEKQTKRELFDALRRELEIPVLDKASKAVWELIVDNKGMGREISETVAKAFYKLSGQEPLQFSAVNGDAGPLKENGEVNKENMDKVMNKGKEKEKGKETPESSSRKRKIDDSKTQEPDVVATDVPTVSGDNVMLPSDLKL